METDSYVGPFELDDRASFKKVIEHYKENLEWEAIQVITVDSFDINEFVKSHKVYEVSHVNPPEKSGHTFLAYAGDLKNDFVNRLNLLEKDRSQLKDDKLKILKFCIRICAEMEGKYDIANYFNFAFGFNWLIKDSADSYHPIPFNNLKFTLEQLQYLREEIDIRKQFFQWMKFQLELVLNTLTAQEFHDPLIKWNPNEKAIKIKIAELFYALRSFGLYEFVDEDSKKRFYNNIEKLFNLKSVNWADLEADIRKRQSKDSTKWIFLKSLIGIKI